ncbi:phosphotransferase family protein [Cryptosporangium phraense]|uniref:Phosphotransferase family protein n=1 Tax=Cryptosporangium phraense TaxID=2593070 RepID=A0A545ARG6_9ACTN|nr:phosphotransferase family protein [Cryptosporangium phraense]TQS43926.1 phosphotransferase family protein [Cryptosporangium phraense]
MTQAAAAPVAVVSDYLATELGDPAWRDCEITLIAGGRSNLTFLVTSAAGEVVLRRPPMSSVLPTAHDMAREHTVISRLGEGRSPVPVPRTRLFCADESVLGAPFYVMDRVPGYVVTDTLPAGYAERPEEREAIGHAVIDVLADLHGVDPAAVGLGEYGRPDGYLERQLRRWTKQWAATRLPDDPAADDLDALAHRLAETRPHGESGPIVHGDYRIGNMILDPDRPGRVAALLDWEMSTLGDPLADVGMLLIYWQESPTGDPWAATTRSAPSVTALDGFPGRRAIVQRYAERTGRSLDHLDWYLGFASFKLAVVAAGVAARGRAGAMIGDGFVEAAEMVGPLVAAGARVLRHGLD